MRQFSIIVLVLTAIAVYADNPSAVVDSLIARGNRCYELSQPSKIKLYADSAVFILSSGNFEDDSRKDCVVSVLKLYGNYHYEMANLDSAAHYYNRAKAIMDKNPDTDFRTNRLLLPREFAQLYYRMGDYGSALESMEEVDSILEYNQPYEIGSDDWLITKMTYAMCLARMDRIDEALEIAATELENANSKEGLSYAKAQRIYAKIKLLANVDRKGTLAAYKDYFSVQKQYARLNFAKMNADEREEYWQTLRPFMTDCYLLEDTDSGFLYDVTLFSKGLLLQLTKISGEGHATEKALKTLDWRWTDIQKRLKPGEAAMEYIQYYKKGEAAMGALILKPTGKPQFIRLTSPDKIMSIAGEALNSTNRNFKDKLYSDETIQSLVWTDTLLPVLEKVKKIYFAPDGYLHRLAIEYMPQVEGKDLYRLTSTRSLMEERKEYSYTDPILAFGDINYDLDKSPGQSAGNDKTAFLNYIGTQFPRLSAAHDETKSIILNRNIPEDSRISASEASEGQFRNLSPGYHTILISTHGDFRKKVPVSTDIKPVMADDVMSESILAFAGINSYLTEQRFDASNNYDGILSARELSQIDLTECRLFTASACQTALGEITSDGVFGLQRGLKNAGVEAMLLSLWNVNGEATSELMRSFYENLGSGMSIHNAFKAARKKLLSGDAAETVSYIFDAATMASRSVVVKNKVFDSPQYSNAFILIDAID